MILLHPLCIKSSTNIGVGAITQPPKHLFRTQQQVSAKASKRIAMLVLFFPDAGSRTALGVEISFLGKFRTKLQPKLSLAKDWQLRSILATVQRVSPRFLYTHPTWIGSPRLAERKRQFSCSPRLAEQLPPTTHDTPRIPWYCQHRHEHHRANLAVDDGPRVRIAFL